MLSVAELEKLISEEEAQKINNIVGKRVRSALAGYEKDVRAKGTVNAERVAASVKDALLEVLKEYSGISGGSTPLGQLIVEKDANKVFDFNESDFIKSLDGIKYLDYDDFVHDLITKSKKGVRKFSLDGALNVTADYFTTIEGVKKLYSWADTVTQRTPEFQFTDKWREVRDPQIFLRTIMPILNGNYSKKDAELSNGLVRYRI